jgi:DNA-binding protein HU-beta
MNKGELVDAIAKASGLSKTASASALDATLDAITASLKTGDKVTLPGFGTFSTSKRSARTGRNPKTKEEIKISAKTVAKFKPGSKLSDAVS